MVSIIKPLTVIRGEYDHGIVGQSLGFQCPDDPSDLVIHFLHQSCINGVGEGTLPFLGPLAVFFH